MNLKEIKELIQLMNENDLMELEVEREESKIKLKKTAGQMVAPIIEQKPIAISSPAAPIAAQDMPAAASNSEALNPNHKHIKSPMVGTFYRAPAPDADSFVEVGQTVEVGQVVCIVEAMKLMNEIKSEVKGKVVKVLTENAQPVEFGQELFAIEPI